MKYHCFRKGSANPKDERYLCLNIKFEHFYLDTSMERNSLMQHIYPKLKEYCREKHGLEFQVVDMRWGVRDEATDDHKTTELCMQEIDNCQRVSVGPNFVV